MIELLYLLVKDFFSELKSINTKLSKMATKADLETGLKRISDAMTNISGDLKALADKLKNNPSQADIDAIGTQILAVADQAEALAAINPDVVPVKPDSETGTAGDDVDG